MNKDINRRIIALSSKIAIDADDKEAEDVSVEIVERYKQSRLDKPICEFDVLVMLMAASCIASMINEIDGKPDPS